MGASASSNRSASAWLPAVVLVAVLVAACGAAGTGGATRTPTPRPSPSATAIPIDPCVVGTWVSGPFTGPQGTGLAGTVLQITPNGQATVLLDNATPIGSPPTSLQGRAQLGLDTGVVQSGPSGSSGTLAVASETDSVTATAGGVSGSLPGRLWDIALYSCQPGTLKLSFQSTDGGYLGNSTVTLSR